MAKMTGQELVDFCRTKLGVPYVYGAKGEKMTAEKFNMLQKLYPRYVPYTDRQKVGRVCVDCSGLISWAVNMALNSAGWKAAADEIHPIGSLGDAPVGALVWMAGHIGVYTGKKNGVCHYIAADGSKHGVREVPISKNNFTHWLLVRDVFDYGEEEEEVKYYEKLNEIPKWAQPLIKDMIEEGCFADRNALHLSDDMIRVMALWERRKK